MFANLAIKRVPHFVGFMARFFHRTLSQIFAAADPDGSGKLLLGMSLSRDAGKAEKAETPF